MTNEEMIRTLREYADWADGEEWEVPIMLADHLRQAADRLEQMPRWISATERLPEDRRDVLVVAYWHEKWNVYMGWCSPERAEWNVHIGIGDRNDVSVTHWMPLPEPPEVE